MWSRTGESASEVEVPTELVETTDNPHEWLSRTPLMMRLMVDVAQGVGGSED